MRMSWMGSRVSVLDLSVVVDGTFICVNRLRAFVACIGVALPLFSKSV
jgi:hypothetical protein